LVTRTDAADAASTTKRSNACRTSGLASVMPDHPLFRTRNLSSSMEEERPMSIYTEQTGRVTTVVLDRPNARNAVTPDMARELAAAFEAFERDESADVAVFWGAHGSFCAGYDLKALAERSRIAEHDFPEDGGIALGPMGPTRLELTKPVIAAVAGPAVAGGMELALWCDLRIMEEDAFFGVYCRRWGVPLIDGGTVRLPRLVGEGRALDIILTGRKVTAQEALAIGLCERVVPRGTARAAAEALAAEIARFPQECLRADRASALRQHGLPLAAALRQEWQGSAPIVEREGIAGAARFAGGRGRHGDFGSI
jgi:enoyl-CoA hydratase